MICIGSDIHTWPDGKAIGSARAKHFSSNFSFEFGVMYNSALSKIQLISIFMNKESIDIATPCSARINPRHMFRILNVWNRALFRQRVS
jgi:hypothetical protein